MNPPAELPLRDIHLPDAVSWWPPAPGWWVLSALLALLALALILILRRYRRRSLVRAARRVLDQAFARHAEGGDARPLLAEVSLVLRRTALSYFPRDEVAGLTGETWLAFLDRDLEPAKLRGGFRTGAGRILATGPYATQSSVDAEALRTLCDAWLRGLERRKRR